MVSKLTMCKLFFLPLLMLRPWRLNLIYVSYVKLRAYQ